MMRNEEKRRVFEYNGNTLSYEELSLLLDLLDLEVWYRWDDDDDFFEKSRVALLQVPGDRLTKVFADFMIWKKISGIQRTGAQHV